MPDPTDRERAADAITDRLLHYQDEGHSVTAAAPAHRRAKAADRER